MNSLSAPAMSRVQRGSVYAAGVHKGSEAQLKGSPQGGSSSEKKIWRERMSALRRSLSTECHRKLSQLICRRLDGLLGVLGAGAVGVYAPVRGEADLSWLWKKSGAVPARAYYFPRVSGNGMTFHLARDPEHDLQPDAFGIPAPSAEALSAPSGSLEVVIAPGLAFDIFGARIGSGAGYYDRWAASGGPRPLLMGAGFEFQLAWDRSLPSEPFDARMDWVVTSREAIQCLPFT